MMTSLNEFKIEKCENIAKLFEDVATLYTTNLWQLCQEVIIASPKVEDSSLSEFFNFSPAKIIVCSPSSALKSLVKSPVCSLETILVKLQDEVSKVSFDH